MNVKHPEKYLLKLSYSFIIGPYRLKKVKVAHTRLPSVGFQS